MAQKPEKFFDIQGRQQYLTARQKEILARLTGANGRGHWRLRQAAVGAARLGPIVLLALLLACDGVQAGSRDFGPVLVLLVPLAGTVWTLMALGGHDFGTTVLARYDSVSSSWPLSLSRSSWRSVGAQSARSGNLQHQWYSTVVVGIRRTHRHRQPS